MVHKFIDNNSKNIIIYFNDMANTDENGDLFSSYKKINAVFFDYDILFIKDIKPMSWYLTIIHNIYNIISEINMSKNYEYMYGLTCSSGAICLLNVLYKFPNFSKAVIINGQISLDNGCIDLYKNCCTDCVSYDKNIFQNPYDIDNKTLNPLLQIPRDELYKFVFYYCNSVSDIVYREYLQTILPLDLHITNIFCDETHISHSGYITLLFTDNVFLENIREKHLSTV
jgi:hypothetical protein